MQLKVQLPPFQPSGKNDKKGREKEIQHTEKGQPEKAEQNIDQPPERIVYGF